MRHSFHQQLHRPRSRTRTFEAEQWLPHRVELVFAFFVNPENLPRLMPRWQKARIEEAAFAPPPPRPVVADPALRLRSIAAGQGSRMTISFRPFPYSPFRVPWETEIASFAWNDHFRDLLIRGPFAYWNHCHRVHTETRTNEDGEIVEGTLLHDSVEYEMHGGAAGELAHRLFIQRQIARIFDYRHQRTAILLPLMRPQRSLFATEY